MNFTTGRNTDKNAVSIQYVGDFTKTGTIYVYETKLSMKATRTILDSVEIGRVRLSRPILTEDYELDKLSGLHQGLIRMHKYKVFCNSVHDLKIINAHYGNIFVGGIEFNLADTVAASNSDYAYEVPMFIYDLPVLTEYLDFGHKVTENLSFSIADYIDNRRIHYDAIQSDNQYGKLNVVSELIDNELNITCVDTKGRTATTYIANDLGLSDITIQCAAKITVRGLNEGGETIVNYSNIVSNSDYSDKPIVYYLPNVIDSVVVMSITIDYIISIHTLSNDIVLHTSKVLTDQQISQLRTVKPSDLV